ncbi:eukaryotic translation initiation factor 3 subunit A-like [Ovis canadensis]|uniref:eukaryotic translation initiation factor 3 subunit A-like n=1 Tax=Ovis canadensis TaxID=37174 RepID=UPI0037518A78
MRGGRRAGGSRLPKSARPSRHRRRRWGSSKCVEKKAAEELEREKKKSPAAAAERQGGQKLTARPCAGRGVGAGLRGAGTGGDPGRRGGGAEDASAGARRRVRRARAEGWRAGSRLACAGPWSRAGAIRRAEGGAGRAAPGRRAGRAPDEGRASRTPWGRRPPRGLCAPAALPGSPAPVPQSRGRGGCGWDTCSGSGRRDAPRRGVGTCAPRERRDGGREGNPGVGETGGT